MEAKDDTVAGIEDLTPGLHAVCHSNAAGPHSHGGGYVSKAAAWLMELGCVFHSVIVGVDLGVTTETSVLTPLFVALVFHQLVEGVSLGTVVAAARFTKAKSFVMAFAYSITTPAGGVAVGIAVSSSYDTESRRAIVTKGCLDSQEGGLLGCTSAWCIGGPPSCAPTRACRGVPVICAGWGPPSCAR
jgi:solute carrier family 39 (zinc transporter), member 1/2/3